MKEGPERIRPVPRSVDELLKHLKDLRGAAPHDVADAMDALREYTRAQREDHAAQKIARERLKTTFKILGMTLGDDEPRG